MIRLNELTKLLPELTYETVKGSNGRVGVIGGSF
jgi:NAD(P)H-hydrate repair Nnr-like enzyme with NAD(P)H-hydrate dehydratase domain